MNASTLVHSIGDRSGGRVQIAVMPAGAYSYVTCEYPEELLEVIKYALGPNSWLKCDDGSIVQLRYVVQARVFEEKAR